ncbi:hypothetical protein TIFTF001_013979 [Ficus carica]|uniref:Transcription factor TFIIIC triple barrel domain-containing protein n=1 Tax=Ficus carica TaxID=3494 RepID=A0AA87ZYQ1_FICCA|nr:hypothetical protein TIFTF001_013979 [Ficus carica]
MGGGEPSGVEEEDGGTVSGMEIPFKEVVGKNRRFGRWKLVWMCLGKGLDTLNPVLIIGDNLKLIGDYEETIGTCLVFTEEDDGPAVREETGPSEANLFSGKCIVDPNQAPRKQVKPMTRLHKILKFRLATDDETQDLITEHTSAVKL